MLGGTRHACRLRSLAVSLAVNDYLTCLPCEVVVRAPYGHGLREETRFYLPSSCVANILIGVRVWFGFPFQHTNQTLLRFTHFRNHSSSLDLFFPFVCSQVLI